MFSADIQKLRRKLVHQIGVDLAQPPRIAPNGQSRAKAGAVNVEGFEVVPDQTDLCYLRRSRVRPWQWVSGIEDAVRAIRGGR